MRSCQWIIVSIIILLLLAVAGFVGYEIGSDKDPIVVRVPVIVYRDYQRVPLSTLVSQLEEVLRHPFGTLPGDSVFVIPDSCDTCPPSLRVLGDDEI